MKPQFGTLACLAALLFVASPAPAQQSWPVKPIKVIIPFSAGSGTDTISRPVLDQLSKQLGQPIIVENRPGAGGSIGMATVASSDPDGYTLLVHSNSFTVVPSTYTNLSFDTERDLVGVVPIAGLPMAMVVPPARGFKSLGEMVAAAKAKPDGINFASAGTGGATHLAAERFRMAAGFKGTHVPYKGSAEAIRDVMTGLTDYYYSPVGLALPLINDGKLVAIAVGSSKRSEALPDVPTTVEAGFPNSDYNVWVGMFAPAKTPQAIIDRLHDETIKALQTPEIQQAFKTLAAERMLITVPQFKSMIHDEIQMNAGLVKTLGITAN
jgi:tripartite-type tricarboxylate transporter receptor subunit TctC